jgi:hypothetical protein
VPHWLRAGAWPRARARTCQLSVLGEAKRGSATGFQQGRGSIPLSQICSIARCALASGCPSPRARTRGTCGRWRSRAQGEGRKRAPARALPKRPVTADIANRDSVNRRCPTETSRTARWLASSSRERARTHMASAAGMTLRTTNSRGGGPRRRKGECASGLNAVISSLRQAPWQHRVSSCRRCSCLQGRPPTSRAPQVGQSGIRTALPQLAAAAGIAAVPNPALARLCQR